MARELLTKAGPFITASLWVVILWFIAADLLEMAVTEWKYLYNSMPSVWRTWLLGFFLVVVTVLLTLWQRANRRFSFWALGVTSVVCVAVLVGHKWYTQHYQWLRRFPQLKSISTMSSIQAQRIEITGRGFGHPGKEGMVNVGDLEFLIITWNDERVVVEQPVPSRYFVGDMVLTNHYGNSLVIEDFTIKDPSEVWE